ncbi:WD40 repeat-like protein [Artomyces pyxidatus]|uniref:WD40 repeat-like protein n=1 Tax=Artomyces pyxidatus TaxID=48021 RepID=A0ACB8T2J2_9AGAM|nr:WD40 repeat-like protein [Artomyces pyxidatus]
MANNASPALKHTLHTPAHVSSLHYTSEEHLLVGSDDGSLRLYRLPDSKVAKAVRGLGAEISSITSARAGSNKTGELWVACGRRVLRIDIESPKIIQSADDAMDSIEIGEDEEDLINEIMLSSNQKHLAFSTDSGAMGVIELATHRISRMRTRHNSICGAVSFIPDRPSEIISGGYDSALLHFDFAQGNILSRHDFGESFHNLRESKLTREAVPPPQDSGVSLSPPFVLCLSVSSVGIIAAGTADGHLWIGTGGEKKPSGAGKNKRTRKWEGLREEDSVSTKVAEGPVVAVRFIDRMDLLACTLLGTITRYTVATAADESTQLETKAVSTTEVTSIAKVNGMATSSRSAAVAGFGKDGKGVVEVYQWDTSA